MDRSHLNNTDRKDCSRQWLVFLFTGLVVGVGSFFQWGNAQQVNQRLESAATDDGVLSAGASHTCGIKRDGTVACWGDHSHGQLSGIPSGTFTQLSAGYDHTCGVKSDGMIVCWGSDLFGQLSTSPIPTGPFTQVSGLCALRTDGSAACWENKRAPIVAVPYFSPKRNPLIEPAKIQELHRAFSGGTFTQISGFCGINSDGTLACWRYNWQTNTIEPSTDIPTGTFRQVSVGAYHACGVKSDGTLACWGDNRQTNTIEPSTDIPTGTFRQVSVGAYHACGVKSDDTLACWGINTKGQLTNMPSGSFTQVSAGASHTCALRSDGKIVCWGDNSQGQLNNIPIDVFGR